MVCQQRKVCPRIYRLRDDILVKISVITATWNCISTISDCLNSVNDQTFGDIEHIVIDGASGDGTVEFLRSRRDQLDVFLSEPDRGIYDALNKGIQRSSGDVVGFLHADDVFAGADVLGKVAREFDKNPEVSAVYGDLHYVLKDDLSHVVRRWESTQFTPKRLAWGWMPPHPTLYVRREWYERIGGFDTQFRVAADYLSVLQLFSQAGFKTEYLPEVLVKMRLGGVSNRSLQAVLKKSQEDWKALRRTRIGALGGFGALVWKNLSKVGQFR
ncbi:MAG: glycosyltransferase [Ramlibacter sp.]|nr:glycosyltransferase [Ramlibacter sp.]